MPFVTDFRMPFRYSTNPHQEEVTPLARQWMFARGLLDEGTVPEYEMARIPELMSGAYPAISHEDLSLSCDAMGVMFTLEDEDCGSNPRPTLDGVAARCKAMAALMHGEESGEETGGDDPVVTAFGQVWQRLCEGMPESWIDRHRTHWREFLDNHYDWEIVVVDRHGIPTYDDYLRDRGTATGMRVLYDWSERLHRTHLPAPVLQDPRLARLGELVIHTIIGINDVHSFERERRRGEKVPNLLSVLMHHEALTQDQAVARAQKLVADAVGEYLDLESAVLSSWWREGLSPERMTALEHYTTALRNWMRSNYQWHLFVPRYGHVPPDADRDRAVTDPV
ncbi:hypothetical protein [Streptomyces sp. WAC06614]|uniref:terpene synthase family protein n=1 Tax=Streptomyces sp. WAC06614 TaxID=2487416 RepID=UPI00163CFA55|nr:hypothetical protein [Streptomyces sp. WAC06614]